MALNNVPLPGQTLLATRDAIDQNFVGYIDPEFAVDHQAFNTPNAGKHNTVTFPVQGAAPVFLAGELGLFSLLNATTAHNELYINKTNQVTVVQIPLTSSILSTNSAPGVRSAGWTYLPSGILMKWGNQNGNGTTNIQVNGIAGQPDFSGVVQVFLTPEASTAGDVNNFVSLKGNWNIPVNNFFQVFCSHRVTTGASPCGVSWLAIGY